MNGATDEPPAGTHCEWCGAEFEPECEPQRPRTKAVVLPPATQGAPVTHCEWCGAEYPIPGEDT